MFSNLEEVVCSVSTCWVTLIVKHDKLSCLCRVDNGDQKGFFIDLYRAFFFLFQFDPD